MVRFIFSRNYEAALTRIEDHIFLTTDSLELVESFLTEHDKALNFIAENPKTPAIHPVTRDQSWNFSDGRYRMFFISVETRGELKINMTHLIDNRELNHDIYPGNQIPTYEEE